MIIYTAGIKQSAESIKKYANMQFNIFHVKAKLIGVVLSIVLVVLGGLAVSNNALSIVLIFSGCVLFTNLNAPANFTANHVAACFHGEFPTLSYFFSPSYFKVGGNDKEIPYEKLVRLAEDQDYLYLFQSSRYGFILKKATINGEDGIEGFKSFLTRETGLKWRKPPTLMNFNLMNLKELFPKSNRYSGPRL